MRSLEQIYDETSPSTPHLLRAAYRYASQNSDDPSTHNGAYLCPANLYAKGLLGTNHFPEKVAKTPDRFERPKKYAYMEHAERDVILKAARLGIETAGATLYVPWFACADCARAIICAGIKKVVGHKQMFDQTPERWKATIADGDAMFAEAGIELEYYDGKIGDCRVLFDGQWWEP